MNEFEALKRLRQETIPATYMPDFNKEECLEVIEKALLELQAIKEAKPSEALECLEAVDDVISIANELLASNSDHSLTTKRIAVIKQALLKADKLEKVWEIVKEKNVDVFMIKRLDNLCIFNNYAKEIETKELTQQEFDLLKEMLE